MAMKPPIPNSAPEEEHPEKYIRTFAGDMEALKGGVAPDLAPLPESHHIPPPPPSALRLQDVPPLPDTGLLPPSQSHAQAQKQSAPEEPTPTPLETYAGDFMNRVKDTHASPMTVLAAEQDAARGAPEPSPVPQEEPPRHTVLYIVVGVTLLLLGMGGAYVASTYYRQTMTPVAVAPSVTAPLFVDDRQEISGTGTELIQAIVKSVASPLSSGSVRLLYTASSTNSESIFTDLGLSAPFVLLRNINPAGSVAGVVNVGGIQSPFFVLSVSSYSDTFSGMLTWEPLMRRDLIALFPPYPVTDQSSTGSAATSTASGLTQGSSTPSAPVPAQSAPTASVTAFADATVANHDVRIYRDSQGRSIVLYGYWNQATLIIARDPAAFTEIVQRLATSRAQ
jgi:hypothetical protein